MNEVTQNHYNRINKTVVKKMKHKSTTFSKNKMLNQTQETKEQKVKIKKTSSDCIETKSPFKFTINNPSKTISSSKKLLINDISFNEKLIDTDLFEEGVKEIFQKMMINMKIIKDTINESDKITQENKKSSNSKETFETIILSRDEKKQILESIITESDQRYNNYESQINSIMENLKQINSIFIRMKERAISTLDTIESQFKDDNIFINLNQKDDSMFHTINTNPHIRINPTLSYCETNPNLAKTFTTNSNKKPSSFGKTKGSNTNSSNTRNPLISLNTTINNNYSTTLSTKATSSKISKQGYLSVDKSNKMSSNMLTMKVHTQSDLNFTINNTITEENQTPVIKITSRYEESEIEEFTGSKQLNCLIYKKNNLAEKDHSPFTKKHYKTPSLIPNIDDTTHEQDILDSTRIKIRAIQHQFPYETLLVTKLEEEGYINTR